MSEVERGRLGQIFWGFKFSGGLSSRFSALSSVINKDLYDDRAPSEIQQKKPVCPDTL